MPVKQVPEKLACAPKMADYHIIIDMLMQRCLGYETMLCPPVTKRTIELGAKYSPDMICTPFKQTLGNFIEAYEQGANVFVMPGAGCRLGFYDILQEQILQDLGYDFEMIPLFDYIPTQKRLMKTMTDINPDLTEDEFNEVLAVVVQVTLDMDGLADYVRRNRAFSLRKDEHQHIYEAYLNEVKSALDAKTAAEIGKKYRQQLRAVEVDKPDKPTRIGIVGEILVVVEPSSNCNIEDWLADHKVEIVRPSDLTQMATAIFSVEDQIKESGGYVQYNIGSTANDAVRQAYQMMQDEIEGIIHVKPASCSPEITAMTILQNMSRDFEVPVMYMTFDTNTGVAGVHTRLEAFLDMLLMKGNT
jgi:predicted nucleotide-binding protein (sugar kinase/HSP70/actin superfamily)